VDETAVAINDRERNGKENIAGEKNINIGKRAWLPQYRGETCEVP